MLITFCITFTIVSFIAAWLLSRQLSKPPKPEHQDMGLLADINDLLKRHDKIVASFPAGLHERDNDKCKELGHICLAILKMDSLLTQPYLSNGKRQKLERTVQVYRNCNIIS